MVTTDIDDPEKPEFASHESYREFARRVRYQRRYVWDEHVKAFIATVLATLKDRDVPLKRGDIFFRAQRGIDYISHGKNEPEEPTGYTETRMKPRPNRSTEGRANAAGVSVLYLGTTEQTVISEVRPWVGAEISVAQFELKRRLRALDLSRGHGQSSLGVYLRYIFSETPLPPEEREKAVWIDIDNAFSEPVTKSDDAAEYVPTQILAEVFRNAGYDAIVYKSQFGEKGFNIVLFNPEDADVINCAPYSVTRFDVSFEQMGNRWFRAKKSRKSVAKSTKKRSTSSKR
ncbi:RES family NAD+ phosphorylase [Sinorhizobium medicae]|uniref:RES family NAD+ phosphorylase n=1 Tax=Sinorhizobium medicae TaxID=110321 RepID=UPI000FD92DE9|nr:RES family NAD+ phosphorylase [Sinorhizobium medicae]RVJ23440.1 RES domain-containing protein [Sinorhizobium medicae]